ncbi:acyl-CoA dehydrogenase family protein [Streptomyces varsoviensis]|uniref:Acyl-CoA dehydrogenase n=1 Tax=Streptomyces varsoviensis TaxID=67373 RepID=A0ABR5J3Q8_9ACTN|nr:acyl-CoA dehydrogenase family protein [Streptomyces varsoviensis]KOG88011.1 acyl-CoA dehydrogenase [Streptomyces varsoviensis]
MSDTAFHSAPVDFLAEPPQIQELRARVREFVDKDVRPRVADNDRAPAEEFDWELVRLGHEAGLLRLVVPKEYGGLGLGVLGVAVALEEIAAACAGTALIFGATLLGQAPVLLSSDPRLQARFLPLFSGDNPVLACNAITEDQAGCDLLIPQNAEHATDVVQARRDGDSYLLTGRKRFITNARLAEFGSVYANIEGHPGATGLTAFIVPLDSPGVTRGPVADKLGYRACLGSELLFDNVRVPAENVVGGEGNGMLINIQQMNMARATVAAISTGVARGAFDLAKDWCAERVQGGVPLHQHQFTARKLAEMTSKVEAARLMYLKAAQAADTEIPAPAYEPATAKLFADQVAIEVAQEAMSLMGARGYLRENAMEKFVRESFGARIYEGTPEVLALAITEALYAEDDF